MINDGQRGVWSDRPKPEKLIKDSERCVTREEREKK